MSLAAKESDVGLLLHREIILDRLYAGNLPGGPGHVGARYEVLNFVGQRDDPLHWSERQYRRSSDSHLSQSVPSRVSSDIFGKLHPFSGAIVPSPQVSALASHATGPPIS